MLDARKARDVPCGSNSASSTRREIEEASFDYALYSQSSARAGYSRGFAVAGRLPSAAHAALARWHERRPGSQGPLRQLLRQRQERQPGWVHRVLCSKGLLPLSLARARGSVRLSMPAPGSQKPWGSALALSQDPVASPCACVHPLNAGPETECAC